MLGKEFANAVTRMPGGGKEGGMRSREPSSGSGGIVSADT